MKHFCAVVTYENDTRDFFRAGTLSEVLSIAASSFRRSGEVPVVAVEWLFMEEGATEGESVGAVRRPDAPRTEAWAEAIDLAKTEWERYEEKRAGAAGASEKETVR